jgi:hypothetical protein
MYLSIKSGNAMHLMSDTSKFSDALASPPCRCLPFYPAARSVHEFIKKNHPSFIPSASSSHVAAPCGFPILDADAHSPRCCRAPHPIARLSPPPVARAGAGGARSAHCVRRPPDQPKLDASGGGARAPPLAAGSHPNG